MPSRPTIDSEKPSLLERNAWMIILAFVLATPFLFYAAFVTVKSKTNQVEDWLPESYTETTELIWFREHFVGDQFVIVSWEGCELGGDPFRLESEPDDPRIGQLADYLLSDQNPDQRFFKSVLTAREILEGLTAPPTELKYEYAVNRLKGALIGMEGRQTCLLVTLSDEAVGNLREVVGRGTAGWLRFTHAEGALLSAMRHCNIDMETVRLGGPPIDSVAIDEEGEMTLYRLATLAALIGISIAWWSLRSIKLTAIVFACGILCAISSLSAVSVTGGVADAFLLSMPSLIYVLSISGAVHLIKYYRDSCEKNGRRRAPENAIIQGWKPTLLCSVTTAIGLLALCTSELTPIKKFGIYAAFGVMLMLVTLFIFLPAALYLWPPKDNRKKAKSTHLINDRETTDWLESFWQLLGGWIIKHYVAVTIACLAVIVGTGLGVTRIKTNIDLMKLFESQATIRQDYQWLEENVGRLVPMEIVLIFDDESRSTEEVSDKGRAQYDLLERIEAVTHVRRVIDARFGPNGQDLTGRTLSAATFVPTIPRKKKGVESYVRRSTMNSKLLESYDDLLDSGYLAIDESNGNELWRLSVRVAAFKDVDYGTFSTQIREIVKPVLEYHNQKLSEIDTATPDTNSNQHLSIVYTGVIPIVYKAQRALLESLMESTFWSFITITPLLILVSRGIKSGLTAMIPNTLPVLVVFGGMGWLSISVTIGSMMSASIALGVAVDDTIHYLMWFRRELGHTSDRRTASLAAYRRCATPTLQAALISGFGMAVFGFSTFAPTKQFGLMILVILLAGVVAELIMLPALLAGPMGRAFELKKSSATDEGTESAEANPQKDSASASDDKQKEPVIVGGNQ